MLAEDLGLFLQTLCSMTDVLADKAPTVSQNMTSKNQNQLYCQCTKAQQK